MAITVLAAGVNPRHERAFHFSFNGARVRATLSPPQEGGHPAARRTMWHVGFEHGRHRLGGLGSTAGSAFDTATRFFNEHASAMNLIVTRDQWADVRRSLEGLGAFAPRP
jgi:hypothetical protein